MSFRLSLLVLLLLTSKVTLGCSCSSTSFAYKFYNNDNVAYGTVNQIQPSKDPDILEGVFTPINVYKGDASKIKIIFGSTIDSASCTRKLVAGDYLIFSKNDMPIMISICSDSNQIYFRDIDKLLSYIISLKVNIENEPPTDSLTEYVEEICKLGFEEVHNACKSMD